MEKSELFKMMANKAIEVTTSHPEMEVSIMDHSVMALRSISIHLQLGATIYDSIWVGLDSDVETAAATLDAAEEKAVRLIELAEKEREAKKTSEQKLAEANEKIAELEAKLEVVLNNAAV